MATISKSVTVADGGTYTLELNAIPTGSTVTPTSNIQTWLHCADIWNKNYTTLNQVLADAGTLQALIASNNAVDYMVRSSSWAGPGLVPAMTSNTTPSGKASASSVWQTGYEAYRAFNGDASQTAGWIASSSNAGEYLIYDFQTAKKLYSFDYKSGVYRDNRGLKSFKIQGSTDGNTYVDLTEEITNSDTGFHKNILLTKNTNTAYRYVKLLTTSGTGNSTFIGVATFQVHSEGIVNNQNAMSYIGANDYCSNRLLANAIWCESIIESQYVESVLNTRVPTMTSNTTPSGVASVSSVWNNNYSAWKAFNNVTSSSINAWLSYKRSASGVAWIQYMFPSAMTLKAVKWIPSDAWGLSLNTLTKIEILGSNDGTNFTSLKTINSPVISYINIYSLSSNTTKYKYYRLQLTGYTNNASVSGVEYECTALLLQFYGRA